MTPTTLIALTNELLAWNEGAHELLGDWLEEHGFGREFHRQGWLHRRDGVVLALINIGALHTSDLAALLLDDEELEYVLEQVNASEHPSTTVEGRA